VTWASMILVIENLLRQSFSKGPPLHDSESVQMEPNRPIRVHLDPLRSKGPRGTLTLRTTDF